ncbi:MAG TPA: thioredoxin-dependent thiol peroxidase [Ignavibacteriaceae bacterium]|jgi:peroxiredoxin Q/BCP
MSITTSFIIHLISEKFMALQVGDIAPSVRLKNQDDKLVSLEDFKGQNIVLYFYPEDDTPGCTKEACSFRDNFPKFGKLTAVVLGVSPDSVKSHKKFVEKYKLPFTLLSDESKEVIFKYDLWHEKSMFGRKYMGVIRTTIIIDKNGRISHIFSKVKVEGHEEEVFQALESLKKK